jgi:hypothetical protein
MIRPGGALNQLYELPGDVLRAAARRVHVSRRDL